MVNLGYTSPPIGPAVDSGERLATTAFDEIKTAFNGRIDWANLSPALQAQLSAGIHSDTPLVSSLPTGSPDGQPIDLLVNPTTIWPLIKVAGKWVPRGSAVPLHAVGSPAGMTVGSSGVTFPLVLSAPAMGVYDITVRADWRYGGAGGAFGWMSPMVSSPVWEGARRNCAVAPSSSTPTEGRATYRGISISPTAGFSVKAGGLGVSVEVEGLSASIVPVELGAA